MLSANTDFQEFHCVLMHLFQFDFFELNFLTIHDFSIYSTFQIQNTTVQFNFTELPNNFGKVQF